MMHWNMKHLNKKCLKMMNSLLRFFFFKDNFFFDYPGPFDNIRHQTSTLFGGCPFSFFFLFGLTTWLLKARSDCSALLMARSALLTSGLGCLDPTPDIPWQTGLAPWTVPWASSTQELLFSWVGLTMFANWTRAWQGALRVSDHTHVCVCLQACRNLMAMTALCSLFIVIARETEATCTVHVRL